MTEPEILFSIRKGLSYIQIKGVIFSDLRHPAPESLSSLSWSLYRKYFLLLQMKTLLINSIIEIPFQFRKFHFDSNPSLSSGGVSGYHVYSNLFIALFLFFRRERL
ncbi:hypothetical protein [Methanosarcina siciliae]|uniref:hypothetical protein n=1 Tax=Methanosarcina siciliae TaxID=38027 RepID=UPI00064EB393|nr:hypothetical protein [Methanosarcina siciliae]